MTKEELIRILEQRGKEFDSEWYYKRNRRRYFKDEKNNLSKVFLQYEFHFANFGDNKDTLIIDWSSRPEMIFYRELYSSHQFYLTLEQLKGFNSLQEIEDYADEYLFDCALIDHRPLSEKRLQSMIEMKSDELKRRCEYDEIYGKEETFASVIEKHQKSQKQYQISLKHSFKESDERSIEYRIVPLKRGLVVSRKRSYESFFSEDIVFTYKELTWIFSLEDLMQRLETEIDKYEKKFNKLEEIGNVEG